MPQYNAGRYQDDGRDFGKPIERVTVVIDGNFRFHYNDTDLYSVIQETENLRGRCEIWLQCERGAVLFKRTFGRAVAA
jgi:hypothetical protein